MIASSPSSVDSGLSTTLVLDWRGAWCAATFGWLWLYPSVLVGLHWQDTSELIATGRALSVAHPPGHPLTLLSVHFSQLAPWLDASARGHLASSFWGMVGIGASYLSLQALWSRGGSTRDAAQSASSPSWQDRGAWLIGALFMVGAPLVWLQVSRAEVYASQWALTSAVWAAALYAERGRDLRGWVVAGLCLGGLAANHTLLTVALSVALLPRLLTLRLSLRVWLMSVGASCLGLSLYLYVWWRGRWGGVSGWGWIDDLESFWKHLSAEVWQRQVSARASEVDVTQNMIEMLAFSIGQVGLWVGVLIMIVLTLGAVRWSSCFASRLTKESSGSDAVSWGPTLAFATLCVACTKLTYPMSVQNPDFSGYLAAAMPSATLLIVCAAQRVNRRRVWIILSLGLIGVTSQRDHARPPESRGAEAWGRQITSEVPTGRTLWSSFYSTHFITSALWVTEGWRPDIRLAFRGHREMSWAERRLALINPLYPAPPLNDPQALSLPLSRYEVERSIDAAPWLWRHLSIPGTSYGQLTSVRLGGDQEIARRAQRASGLELMRSQTQRVIELGDALTSPRGEADSRLRTRYVCDEDTAYAWALHHEVSLRWIQRRLEGIDVQQETHVMSRRAELTQAARSHKMLLDWWIHQIATERLKLLDFSWSAP